jgi:hypothetical protein
MFGDGFEQLRRAQDLGVSEKQSRNQERRSYGTAVRRQGEENGDRGQNEQASSCLQEGACPRGTGVEVVPALGAQDPSEPPLERPHAMLPAPTPVELQTERTHDDARATNPREIQAPVKRLTFSDDVHHD